MSRKSNNNKNKKSPEAVSALSQNTQSGFFLFNLLIIISVFVFYGNTISNGYVLDDFSVIKSNNIVNLGVESLGTIFKTSYRAGYLNLNDGLYRPLSLAMFAIEWTLAPDNPAPSHFINLIVFALCGIVVFKTLLKLFPGINRHVIFGMVLLFMAHPIHTEVVGNIKSRDELLCFLFSFLSINHFWKHLETSKKVYLLTTPVFLFLAFLSKESAILTIPIFLLMIFFFKRDWLTKSLMQIWLFIIPFILYMLIRKSVLGSFAGLQDVPMVDNPVGKQTDIVLKLFGIIQIFGDYIRLFLFPHPLIFDYSYNSIPLDQGISAGIIFGMLSLITLVFLALYTFKKQRIISFSIFFIFVGLSLYSNLVFTIGAAKAERFTFLASLGFCMLLSYMVAKVLKLDLSKNSTSSFNTYYVVLTAIVLTYSVKTISRNKDWKDNMTLYTHDLKLNPNSGKIHYLRGFVLIETYAEEEQDPAKKKEMYYEAINEMNTALKIYPDFNYANTEIGLAYYRMNNFDSAIDFFKKDLLLDSNNNVAMNNLASCYFNRSRYADAAKLYIKSIALNPRYSEAMVNLGSCNGALGNYKEAMVWFTKSLEFDPENKRTFSLMSMTYKNMGDSINARRYDQLSK